MNLQQQIDERRAGGKQRLDNIYVYAQLRQRLFLRDCLTSPVRRVFTLDADPTRKFIPLCSRWTCPTCFNLLWSELEASLTAAIRTHHLTHHLTLTLAPSELKLPAQDRVLKGSLRQFFNVIRRRLHRSPSYVWAVGCDGRRLHLHMLINLPIGSRMRSAPVTFTKTWLKKAWHTASQGAYQIRIRQINPDDYNRLVHYLICNQLHTVGYGALSPKSRRVNASDGIQLFPSHHKPTSRDPWTMSMERNPALNTPYISPDQIVPAYSTACAMASDSSSPVQTTSLSHAVHTVFSSKTTHINNQTTGVPHDTAR